MGRCLAGTFFLNKNTTFFKAGGSGVGRCLAGAFFFSQKNDLFQSRGLRCGALPRRDFCVVAKTTPSRFLDNTFRVNVAKSQCLPVKYSLSELAGRSPELGGLGPELTGLATRNDTRSAAWSLPSTRAWGKDDGS